jgi:hypothetical protein
MASKNQLWNSKFPFFGLFYIVGLEKVVKDEFVALKLFLTAYILHRLGRFTKAIQVRGVTTEVV